MVTGTFVTPAPWGIGPGPARLYSIAGALHAVRMWLDLTPDRPDTRRERELMLTLRDLLAAMPISVTETDRQSAKRAIKGMVTYSRSRLAESLRVESYLRLVPRRSVSMVE
ncbi:hypothetical protein [Reyranella sp. CPCC 100927]|uniref:hypothetical protein n=1 Tax=Reyranella sp. CPCC 100927 TaxID=2599616 RepID=UPI0011B3EBD4|nr:hypothetical protein [Reyranella sp. CPCC 100927]TWS97332.1 hypothetical protein FQU96_37685 [Reyranella sp. CPCC 100927]